MYTMNRYNTKELDLSNLTIVINAARLHYERQPGYVSMDLNSQRECDMDFLHAHYALAAEICLQVAVEQEGQRKYNTHPVLWFGRIVRRLLVHLSFPSDTHDWNLNHVVKWAKINHRNIKEIDHLLSCQESEELLLELQVSNNEYNEHPYHLFQKLVDRTRAYFNFNNKPWPRVDEWNRFSSMRPNSPPGRVPDLRELPRNASSQAHRNNPRKQLGVFGGRGSGCTTMTPSGGLLCGTDPHSKALVLHPDLASRKTNRSYPRNSRNCTVEDYDEVCVSGWKEPSRGNLPEHIGCRDSNELRRARDNHHHPKDPKKSDNVHVELYERDPVEPSNSDSEGDDYVCDSEDEEDEEDMDQDESSQASTTYSASFDLQHERQMDPRFANPFEDFSQDHLVDSFPENLKSFPLEGYPAYQPNFHPFQGKSPQWCEDQSQSISLETPPSPGEIPVSPSRITKLVTAPPQSNHWSKGVFQYDP